MFSIRRRSVPSSQDLLKEYESAQLHVSTLSSSVFQSTAIVVGGSIAALALLVEAEFSRELAIAVTTLAVGAVFIIELWLFNWRRHEMVTYNHATRMRAIERLRGMRKNIYMYLLSKSPDKRRCTDEWTWLSREERERFPRPYDELPKFSPFGIPMKGWDVLQVTARAVQVGWLMMIVYAWVQAENLT
ncbi:MAG: hypothetical protein IH957_07215 [Chloroflexi bacterium]|nr:hypothetical protein [Chloroflexota bacterium]